MESRRGPELDQQENGRKDGEQHKARPRCGIQVAHFMAAAV